MSNLDKLQEIIGWKFRNIDLLKEAITHSSFLAKKNFNNERMEFLGDRVLGIVIADILFKKYPDEDEGGLAKRHSALVSGKTLALIAKEIDIGKYMEFSDSEKSTGGASNSHLLANAMEALLGAIYLDGDLQPCKKIIGKLWEDKIDMMVKAPQDPKTELQEWAQARKLGIPEYKIIEKNGPDHSPVFVISLHISGYNEITAKGSSKRKAEKKAATLFLEKIKDNG